MIASDFAGPFNKTPSGNKYIQVITDLYTKYMMVIRFLQHYGWEKSLP